MQKKIKVKITKKDESFAFLMTFILYGVISIIAISISLVMSLLDGTFFAVLGRALAITSIFAFGVILASIEYFDILLKIKICIKKFWNNKFEIATPSRYKLLKLSEALYSSKTQKEVFLVIMADWDDEIYQSLKEDKNANLSMINVRYTYAFLAAMWMKSPIGDLIEFVIKIAKP